MPDLFACNPRSPRRGGEGSGGEATPEKCGGWVPEPFFSEAHHVVTFFVFFAAVGFLLVCRSGACDECSIRLKSAEDGEGEPVGGGARERGLSFCLVSVVARGPRSHLARGRTLWGHTRRYSQKAAEAAPTRMQSRVRRVRSITRGARHARCARVGAGGSVRCTGCPCPFDIPQLRRKRPRSAPTQSPISSRRSCRSCRSHPSPGAPLYIAIG